MLGGLLSGLGGALFGGFGDSALGGGGGIGAILGALQSPEVQQALSGGAPAVSPMSTQMTPQNLLASLAALQGISKGPVPSVQNLGRHM